MPAPAPAPAIASVSVSTPVETFFSTMDTNASETNSVYETADEQNDSDDDDWFEQCHSSIANSPSFTTFLCSAFKADVNVSTSQPTKASQLIVPQIVEIPASPGPERNEVQFHFLNVRPVPTSDIDSAISAASVVEAPTQANTSTITTATVEPAAKSSEVIKRSAASDMKVSASSSSLADDESDDAPAAAKKGNKKGGKSARKPSYTYAKGPFK